MHAFLVFFCEVLTDFVHDRAAAIETHGERPRRHSGKIANSIWLGSLWSVS